MFRRLILVSLGVLGAQNTLAFAGWNSGGGELFSDEKNPWFLENTKRIDYCIEADGQHFGQSIDVARSKIKVAFNYWKSEFAKVGKVESDGQILRLATQQAVETDCYEGIDLKFQLGTLTQEQAQYLKFPGKVIGRAVRTSYDTPS
jgi:hypothetical protein